MTAVEVLEALGCGHDPVIYRGKEIDVSRLEHALNVATKGNEFHVHASRVKITYYRNRRESRKQGTLLAMVRDRFNDAVTGRI